MPDILTPDQRHKCMSHIRSRNTKPEVKLRKELFRLGYRYRLNVKGLDGRPDIVLAKYRTCIFVNGCFWHGHKGCPKFVLPKTNVEFWLAKIENNRERDLKITHFWRAEAGVSQWCGSANWRKLIFETPYRKYNGSLISTEKVGWRRWPTGRRGEKNGGRK